MVTDVKHRQRLRGSATENDSYTGLEGEVTVDLTTPNLRLHNGKTPGGFPVAMGSELKEYLPLAGGTMTGRIACAEGVDRLIEMTQTEGMDAYPLVVKNDKHSISYGIGESLENRGIWDSTTNAWMINLDANGTLKSKNMSVECVNSQGSNWIRFQSGLQIVWSSVSATSSWQTWTLPVAFKDANYSVATGNVNGNASGTVRAAFAPAIVRSSSSIQYILPTGDQIDDAWGFVTLIGYWK